MPVTPVCADQGASSNGDGASAVDGAVAACAQECLLPIKCLYCPSLVMPTFRHLALHHRSCHEGKKVFCWDSKCLEKSTKKGRFGGGGYPTPEKLKDHRKRLHPIGASVCYPYVFCVSCFKGDNRNFGEPFTSWDALRKHKMQEHPDELFYCWMHKVNKVDYFGTVDGLKEHLESEHAFQLASHTNSIEQPRCTLCDTRFESVSDFIKHWRDFSWIPKSDGPYAEEYAPSDKKERQIREQHLERGCTCFFSNCSAVFRSANGAPDFKALREHLTSCHHWPEEKEPRFPEQSCSKRRR